MNYPSYLKRFIAGPLVHYYDEPMEPGEGWESILKPYQIVAMKYLWRNDVDHGSSRHVYEAVNKEMGANSISRASIINSLNMLVDEGVLSFHEITGKGGHRRIYKPVYDETETKMFLAKKFVDKLNEIFPEIALSKT